MEENKRGCDPLSNLPFQTRSFPLSTCSRALYKKSFFLSNHQSLFTEFDKTCRDFIFLPNGCIVTCISVEQSKKNEYKSKGDFVIVTCFTFKENFVCKHKYLILLSLIRSIASFFLSLFFFFFCKRQGKRFVFYFREREKERGNLV